MLTRLIALLALVRSAYSGITFYTTWNCTTFSSGICYSTSPQQYMNSISSYTTYPCRPVALPNQYFGAGTKTLMVHNNCYYYNTYANLKVFSAENTPTVAGTFSASPYSSTTYSRSVLAFFNTGYFLWGDPGSYMLYGRMTYSSGTVSFSSISEFSLAVKLRGNTNATLQDPTDSYLYAVAFENTSMRPYKTMVVKIPLQGPPITPGSAYLNLTAPMFGMIWYSAPFAYASAGAYSIQVIDMSALSEVTSYSFRPGSTYALISMLYDPALERLIASMTNGNIVKFRRITSATKMLEVEQSVGTSYSYSRLIDVPNYGLFYAHFVDYWNRFRLFTKKDFTVALDQYNYEARYSTVMMSEGINPGDGYTRWYVQYMVTYDPAYVNAFYFRIDDYDSGSPNVTACGTSGLSGYNSIAPANGTSNSKCIPTMLLPSGYGFAGYNVAAQPCAVTNCVKCQLDYTLCMKCDTGYYLWSNTTCYDLASIPAGRGVDEDNVVPCAIPNCITCTSDAYGCTACDTGFRLYGGRCVYDSTHLSFGWDTVSGLQVPCQDPMCLNCTANYQVCITCDVSKLYFLVANGTCIPWYEAPTGFGMNSGRTALTTCYYTSQCKNCSYSYYDCVECLTQTPKLYLLGEYCYQSYNIPYGRGANLTSTSNVTDVAFCQDINCYNCSIDYTVCVQCNSTSGDKVTYLYNSACWVPMDLPTGFGPSLSSSPRIAVSCQDPNCDDCKADSTKCRKCKAGLTPQLYASTSGICIPVSSIPSGSGASSNYSVQPCSDTYCALCQSNNLVCTQCSGSYSRYLYNGVCLPTDYLTNGVGAVLATQGTAPCADTNCLNCSANYLTCTTCDPTLNPPRYLYSGQCLLASSLPNKSGANVDSLMSVSCFNTYCLKCQNDYRICTECDNTGTFTSVYYLYDNSCFTSAALPAYYGANTVTYIATLCSQATCKYCRADYTKCTQCKPFTSPMTYLYSPNSTCLLESEIPDTYGAKVDSSGFGTAIACYRTTCQKCQADYMTCTQCKVNTPPYYLYSNNCVDNSTLPDTIGANTTSMIGQSCLSSRCQKCNADYRNCTFCLSQTPKFYLYETTGECLLPAELPISVGANTTSGNATYSPRAVPCQKAGCQDCRNDFTVCLGCSVVNGTATYLYMGNCVTADVLPPYYGADNATYAAVACSNPRCKYCRYDYTSCTQCNIQSPDLYLYVNGTNVSCLTILETPAGMGADLASLTLRTCATSGCDACFNDYLKCTSCNESVIPRVYFYLGNCLLPASIPDPNGADTVSGLAIPCADPNCNSCKQNYGYCTDCKRVNPETFLFAEFGTCVLKKAIPDGFGPDFSNYTLRACLDPNCKVCSSNYQRCQTCKSTPEQYYVNASICLKLDEVLPGYGIDVEGKAVLACKSLGCINCQANYSKCIECVPPPAVSTPQNPKYYLFEDRCDTCTTKPLKIVNHVCKSICDKTGCSVKLIGTKFLKSKKQVRAQFSEAIERNMTARYFLSFEGLTGTRNLSSTEYEIQILSDVMLITLNLQDAVASGTLYFDRVDYEEILIQSASSKAPFFDYPIKFLSIYLETSAATSALGSASSTSTESTASAKLVAQLVVITQNSNIAKIPDQMVANMVFLRFLNGETYLYPAMVFDFFQGAQLPFITLNNPWQDSAKQPNCMVAPKFYDANLDCSILVNYGVDIVILYCTLAINILLSLAYYLTYGARLTIYKRHGETEKVAAIEKSLCHKIFRFFNENYGLKMFFVKLDGTMVEVLFYASLTTTSQSIANSSYFLAYATSLLFYGYYVWSLSTYVRLLVYLKPRLDNIRKAENENKAADPKYKVKDLSHYVDFNRVKHGLGRLPD
jgi:hypothetical protein